MSTLHSQITKHEEFDQTLFFALGIAKCTSQLLCFVNDHTLTTVEHEKGFWSGEQVVNPETLLFFLLGLVSFSNRYQEILEKWDDSEPGLFEELRSRSTEDYLSLRELLI
jgi:hypothetical protein